MSWKLSRSNPVRYSQAACALAEAFQGGQDCGFALHDALLELGLLNEAEHFVPHDGGPACLPGGYCLIVAEILDQAQSHRRDFP